MTTKEILRQVVINQKNELNIQKETVRRELLDKILDFFEDERIIILTGIRRCGKSTLLKQLMQNTSGWCYLNFEDERLIDFNAKEFETLNEVLIEAYGQSKIYFFDEIQNVEKFETFVRRLQDEDKKIILTGSNASLLSKEFGTRLTGRYKVFEVYPFSFNEFLLFKNMAVKKDDFYLSEKKINLQNLFEEYLVSGGFPEYLKNQDEDYLKTVYENILYKDIIVRYSIKKEKILKELVSMLATNASCKFTYNSLKKTLGLGNAITVKEYISYLGNSYLFFEVLKFSHSLRQQLNSPRKIYLVDQAFNKVSGLTFTPNKGRNLENLIFIELKRQNKEIYYYSNKNECDFLVKEGNIITKAIQVSYILDESNREREINGLIDAMNALKLKEGLIITFEQTEDIKIEDKRIKVIPAYRWIIEVADYT
ncbi:MAG TPA: ATP-binding protein [Methanofastidiosum sp.]|nr:ATP-binding protein [Methanofastidiosum sp.]HNU61233.1 ATP-binding protein [Methanofastidiosum sp.]